MHPHLQLHCKLLFQWQGLCLLEKNTWVLKDLVPALQDSLLHTGGGLSAGQLQGVLAHCRQELENQLSAFCLTSTTFATERQEEEFAHFQPPGKKPYVWPALQTLRKTGVIRNGTWTAEYPFKIAEYDIQHKIQVIFRLHATVQAAPQSTDCVRMYTTPVKKGGALGIQTTTQQFSSTWKNKAQKHRTGQGGSSEYELSCENLGFYCSDLEKEGALLWEGGG